MRVLEKTLIQKDKPERMKRLCVLGIKVRAVVLMLNSSGGSGESAPERVGSSRMSIYFQKGS